MYMHNFLSQTVCKFLLYCSENVMIPPKSYTADAH